MGGVTGGVESKAVKGQVEKVAGGGEDKSVLTTVVDHR